MHCNTSRCSYITSSQNWTNFLTEVSSPNTLLRLARTDSTSESCCTGNNTTFSTMSAAVHEEAVSEARVTDAELTQNNLFSTAHVESSNPWLGTVLDDPSKCRSTYAHKPLLLISLWH